MSSTRSRVRVARGEWSGEGRKVRRLSNMCVAINFGFYRSKFITSIKNKSTTQLGEAINERVPHCRWVVAAVAASGSVCLPEITRKGAAGSVKGRAKDGEL